MSCVPRGGDVGEAWALADSLSRLASLFENGASSSAAFLLLPQGNLRALSCRPPVEKQKRLGGPARAHASAHLMSFVILQGGLGWTWVLPSINACLPQTFTQSLLCARNTGTNSSSFPNYIRKKFATKISGFWGAQTLFPPYSLPHLIASLQGLTR